MKLRDSKNHRNDRLSKQKLREWKIQMNVVGRPTGAHDVDGNEIKIGDEVLVKDYWKAIVLYSDLNLVPQKYPVLLRGCWYGEDIYHPDSYGKWEGIVKPTKHNTLKVIQSPCIEKCY